MNEASPATPPADEATPTAARIHDTMVGASPDKMAFEREPVSPAIVPPERRADRPARSSDAASPVGEAAPALNLEHWIHSSPLEIRDLIGKVVLIRWWTDECPYCAATAPALRTFDRRYRDRGLTVIGVFHPKPAGDPRMERMTQAAKRFDFTFPIALDADWRALGRWWLDRRPQAWTSVTFLVDRKGIVRYVHPGGEFHEGAGGAHLTDHTQCHEDYREIEAAIQGLLSER